MEPYTVDLNKVFTKWKWPQWLVLRFYTRSRRVLIPLNYIWDQIQRKGTFYRYKSGSVKRKTAQKTYSQPSHPSSNNKEIFPYEAVNVRELSSWLRNKNFFLEKSNYEHIVDNYHGEQLSFYRINFWYQHWPSGAPVRGYKYDLQEYVSKYLLAKYEWKIRVFYNTPKGRPTHVSFNFDSRPETPSRHQVIKLDKNKGSFLSNQKSSRRLCASSV